MTAEIVKLPPPDPKEEPELREKLKMVSAYTLPIMVDCVNRTSKVPIGTAVLIRIADRLFAATAKHCVVASPLLVVEQNFSLPAKPTRVRKILGHPSLDVGLVELDPELTPRGCSLDNLDVSLPEIPEDPRTPKPPFHWIVGYPDDETAQVGGILRLPQVWVSTHPIIIEEHRYTFSYPLQFYRIAGDTPKLGDQPQTPVGFSGGGLWWFVQPEAGELVSPERNVRLRGIQSAWFNEKRHSYLIPIKCWIQLVYDYYPVLRTCLKNKFPFLGM
jgi:hypothetical protein